METANGRAKYSYRGAIIFFARSTDGLMAYSTEIALGHFYKQYF
jgi:hypothetical protein